MQKKMCVIYCLECMTFLCSAHQEFFLFSHHFVILSKKNADNSVYILSQLEREFIIFVHNFFVFRVSYIEIFKAARG